MTYAIYTFLALIVLTSCAPLKSNQDFLGQQTNDEVLLLEKHKHHKTAQTCHCPGTNPPTYTCACPTGTGTSGTSGH